MHGPAPVSLEAAGDGGAWRLALGLLHVAAAGALAAWRPGVAMAAAGLGLLAVGAWLMRAEARAPRPVLAWDGQGWRHGGDPVCPRVALDLGLWMLLRLARADGGAGWLPVSAAAAGGAWAALRAALFAGVAARAGAGAAPAGNAAA